MRRLVGQRRDRRRSDRNVGFDRSRNGIRIQTSQRNPLKGSDRGPDGFGRYECPILPGDHDGGGRQGEERREEDRPRRPRENRCNEEGDHDATHEEHPARARAFTQPIPQVGRVLSSQEGSRIGGCHRSGKSVSHRARLQRRALPGTAWIFRRRFFGRGLTVLARACPARVLADGLGGLRARSPRPSRRRRPHESIRFHSSRTSCPQRVIEPAPIVTQTPPRGVSLAARRAASCMSSA